MYLSAGVPVWECAGVSTSRWACAAKGSFIRPNPPYFHFLKLDRHGNLFGWLGRWSGEIYPSESLFWCLWGKKALFLFVSIIRHTAEICFILFFSACKQEKPKNHLAYDTSYSNWMLITICEVDYPDLHFLMDRRIETASKKCFVYFRKTFSRADSPRKEDRINLSMPSFLLRVVTSIFLLLISPFSHFFSGISLLP